MAIEFQKDFEEEEERIVTSSLTREDDAEASLRPRTLEEYVGQQKVKENLSVFIDAARDARRGAGSRAALRAAGAWARPPWLRSSPAEMGVNIRITSGPAIEKAGDLAALLTNLGRG